MVLGYLGGMLTRDALERQRTIDLTSCAGGESWCGVAGDRELFVRTRGPGFRLFVWDSLALVVRGYVRVAGSSGAADAERVAEEVRCQYLERGELAVDGLDGSFSLALLDAQARRVFLYRNLVGAGFTYYHVGPDGLLFGGNLADLVDTAGVTARPNEAALPTFFLYRFVPGRETLFDDFYRLLPGEQLTWDERGLARVQRHTFASVREARPVRAEALERLEETMGRVLRDCADHRPGTANLLSGGIDSTYLQAVWNRVAAADDDLPRSFSVSVDHPRSWADTDYAVTAAQALGTRHTLVPADAPYADYLLDTLSATGEPPNHVQTAYFGRLARTMVGQGVASGLCGEGADSLFGLGLADEIHDARWMRRVVPGRRLRRLGGKLAGLAGWSWPAAALRLANRIDNYLHLAHPVNQVAAFTDWPAVEVCFGGDGVARAAANRRALLDRFEIPRDPLDRLHGAGFLGEAMDSASLWATLFQSAGAELLCPFLDSRVVRLAVSLAPEVRYRPGRPKDLLKRALTRHVPPLIVRRGKLGFGQPIFEWLAPGGQLRPLVERVGAYAFLDPAALQRSLAKPNWFLYSLLCYDLWHKLFIERSLPRPVPGGLAPAEEAAVDYRLPVAE